MRFSLRNFINTMDSDMFIPSGDPQHEKYINGGLDQAQHTDEIQRLFETVDFTARRRTPSCVQSISRTFIKLLAFLFILAVMYTAGGHLLQQLRLWDPCSKRFVYRKSYVVDSYGGGYVLQCTRKEDYVCLVPGFQGERMSTGWDLTGTGCDDGVLTRHQDSYRSF